MSNDFPIEGTPEQVAAYCKAFKAMQATFGSVPKNKSAPINKAGDRFRFTDYDGLVEYLRPFFAEHGFFHQATPGSRVEKVVGAEGEYLAMVASGEVILAHQEGALARAAYAMPAGSPRDAGGIHTYCKRYALAGLAGITSDEDTDAAGIENPPPQQAQRARQEPPKQQTKPHPSDEREKAQARAEKQMAQLKDLLKSRATSPEDEADFKELVAKHSVDAWASVPSVLAKKLEVFKLDEVLRWADENIGKLVYTDAYREDAEGDTDHPGHPSNHGDH